MGVIEGSPQVIDVRGAIGKLTYSITIQYIPVALVVLVVHTICYICDSMRKI